MGSTTNFDLPYPETTDTPDGPKAVKDLAEAVEREITAMYGGFPITGNLTVSGTLSAGSASGDVIAATTTDVDELNAEGDLTVSSGLDIDGRAKASRGGLANTWVSRLIKGKVHTGSTTGTTVGGSGTGTGPESAVTLANMQNVPLVAGRLYVVVYEFQMVASATGNRARLRLWDGSVGTGTLWNGQAIIKAHNAGGATQNGRALFWRRETVTHTASNLNLSVSKFSSTSGGGTVTINLSEDTFIGLCFERF